MTDGRAHGSSRNPHHVRTPSPLSTDFGKHLGYFSQIAVSSGRSQVCLNAHGQRKTLGYKVLGKPCCRQVFKRFHHLGAAGTPHSSPLLRLPTGLSSPTTIYLIRKQCCWETQLLLQHTLVGMELQHTRNMLYPASRHQQALSCPGLCR